MYGQPRKEGEFEEWAEEGLINNITYMAVTSLVSPVQISPEHCVRIMFQDSPFLEQYSWGTWV
jgi:hypothetical protein